MGMSSSVGGNAPGGQSMPMQRDLETTAWTEHNKAALGIVPDSIDKSFTDMNPRYNSSQLGGFGYKTTANSPWLSHPLEMQRQSALSPLKPSEDAKQAKYQSLVSQLPADLQTRFLREMEKPYEKRDLSFVALDKRLQNAAGAVTDAESLAQPAAPGSIEDARTTLNILLPFAALKGATANSSELMGSASNFLADQGANYPSFDGFNNVINQLQRPMSLLSTVNNSLGNTVNGQLSPQATAAAGKAAQLLASIGSQWKNVSLGSDLQFLLSNISAMETIATALSLPNTNTASLFIALATASNGLSTADSAGGILGRGFTALTDGIAQAVAGGVMSPNNKAGNEMLSYIVPLSMTLFTGMASLAAESGVGAFPQRDSQDVAAANAFSFEIALQLVVSSGVLNAFYQEAIAASGGSQQAQDLGSAALATVANLLMIQSGSNEDKKQAAILAEDIADDINKGLIAAEELEKTRDAHQIVNSSIALNLASLALQSQDYDNFSESFGSYLESLGTSQTALTGDIVQINGTTNMVSTVLGLGDPNKQLTSITNVV